VERLDNLINHLLDAARLEKSIVPGEEEDVDVAALLQRCIQAVAQRQQVSSDSFELQLQPVLVRARPVDLDLIFRNLIDNAVKYGGTPPQVRVEMQRLPPDKLVVQISDNGRGIPAHQRWKLFGRFMRLGSELEREKPGTGLGLYIVHTLVSRLKGKIRVRDREGNQGSVFEVTLRCLPE
jgi:signal transduction histidine kinase